MSERDPFETLRAAQGLRPVGENRNIHSRSGVSITSWSLARLYASFERQENGCWIWRRAVLRTVHGDYPVFASYQELVGLGHASTGARRLLYQLETGERLESRRESHARYRVCLPSCGERRCVAPEHCELSTASELARQAAVGRQGKLVTPEQVREIRRRSRAGERGRDLAREFHLDDTYVSKIIRRRIWANLDDEEEVSVAECAAALRSVEARITG